MTFYLHHKEEIKYKSEACLGDCDWHQPADVQVFCGYDAQRTSRKTESVDSLSAGSRPAEQLPAFPRNVRQSGRASALWQDNYRAWHSIPLNILWFTINRIALCPFHFLVQFSKNVKVTQCSVDLCISILHCCRASLYEVVDCTTSDSKCLGINFFF